MNLELAKKNKFVHAGVITKIAGDSVIVSLEQNLNCESCRAKSTCGISESNMKEVEILKSNDSFKINEQVNVVLKKSLGLKAVFWAYVFPFIFMFVTLISASLFLEEWAAGFLSLLVLIPYYTLLYFFKNTFKSVFKIHILKP